MARLPVKNSEVRFLGLGISKKCRALLSVRSCQVGKKKENTEKLLRLENGTRID
jgi:hypothetical protein